MRSDGTIYITDPLYGDYPPELDFRGVFRISPDGGLTAEHRADNTEAPNGLALSPDESRLYVANWADDLVWILDIAADGSLSAPRTFVNTGDGPDGMAVDTGGNLFVATGDGIEVFAPDGTPWGVIPVPRIPSNCAFGGADGRTLYTPREKACTACRYNIPAPTDPGRQAPIEECGASVRHRVPRSPRWRGTCWDKASEANSCSACRRADLGGLRLSRHLSICVHVLRVLIGGSRDAVARG